MTRLSDNPGATTGVIGIFVASLLALASTFGVRITPEQTTAILVFVAALFGLVTWLLNVLTVPRTPSSISAPLQTPPPGTVLVATKAAEKPAVVKSVDIVAGPTPPTP